MDILFALVLGLAFVPTECDSALTSAVNETSYAKKLLVDGGALKTTPITIHVEDINGTFLDVTPAVPQRISSVREFKRLKAKGTPRMTRNNRKRNRLKGSKKKTSNRGGGRKTKKKMASVQLQQSDKILRNTIMHMFGFDHMNSAPHMLKQTQSLNPTSDDASGVPSLTGGSSSSQIPQRKLFASNEDHMPKPPDFMLDLYRTYSEDKSLMLLHSQSQGNTVRSFLPAPADHRLRDAERGMPQTITPVTGENKLEEDTHPYSQKRKIISHKSSQISVFLFNLSSVPNPESLVNVEIRLDRYAKRFASTKQYRSVESTMGNGSTVNRRSMQQSQDRESRDSFENAASHPSWNLYVGVYQAQQINCEDEIDCDNNISQIFVKVGNTSVLTSESTTTWSDHVLIRQATEARKAGHVMIVKFEGNDFKWTLDEDNEVNLRRSRRGHERFEFPNSFAVIDAERPKRNSDYNWNNNYGELASTYHATNVHQTTDGEGVKESKWSEYDFHGSRIPILILYCNDSRSAVAADVPSPVPHGIVSERKRNRRSLGSIVSDETDASDTGSNQIPGDTGRDYNEVSDMEVLHYSQTKRRTSHDAEKTSNKEDESVTTKRPSLRHRNVLDNDQTELHDNGKSSRRVIAKLQDRNLARQRKRYRKCKSKKGKNRKKCKTFHKKAKPHSSMLTSINRLDAACGRRSLHVDFATIGWSDWIISPKFFDAYYCTGKCELSQIQESGTSNHAIIQAVIKAMGVNKEVPAPCCVPEKLMSLSVLFFDEDRNVVLKVYPNMSVETCACR